jgi:hypothetical protein
MSDTRNGLGWGVLGLIVGFLAGAGIVRAVFPLGSMGTGAHAFGMMLLPLLFVTLWILLIAAAIRWLFVGRHPQRLADLPADFDDWHRRAHAQMAREAASAHDPGGRG